MTNVEIELGMADLVFKDNDTIIFPSINLNGLFSASIKTGKAYLVRTFPGEEMYKKNLYCGAHKYKHYILFVPARGRHLLVYDMDKDAFKSILDGGASPSIFRYGASILVNKYVYIFGATVSEILRIDMENFQVKHYEGWLEKICRYGEKKENPYFYGSVCMVNNSLFVVTGQSNSILELNMQNDNLYIHPIGEKEDIFKALAWDGESFLLMDQAQNILRADIEKGSFQYLKIENNVLENWFPFSIVMGDEVWFVSNIDEEIVKINRNSILNSRLGTEFYGLEQRENGYSMVKKIEKKLFLFSTSHYELHLFERGQGIKKIKLFWEASIRDYYDKYPKGYYHLELSKDSKIYAPYENIESFIKYIENTNNINAKEIEKSNIGKKTYDLIAYY